MAAVIQVPAYGEEVPERVLARHMHAKGIRKG
jgi:hypothetical protein